MVTASRRITRSLAFAGLALYAAFLLVAPFTHHDLLCELKTPQHCTACASSVVGSDPTRPAIIGAWILTDAGSADARATSVEGALLTVRSTGRSPPSAV
jgi:hypothetical protein